MNARCDICGKSPLGGDHSACGVERERRKGEEVAVVTKHGNIIKYKHVLAARKKKLAKKAALGPSVRFRWPD